MAYIKGNVKIGKDVFLAHDSDIVCDVEIGDNSSIWYHTVLRGDNAKIVVGENTNIQDNTVVHAGVGFKTTIGNNVTIGHSAIIHGCTIEDNVLVGMGATIMNGAVIGKNSIIGAEALVTQGQIIPENSLVVGFPAKVVRSVTEKEIEKNMHSAEEYKELKDIHMKMECDSEM